MKIYQLKNKKTGEILICNRYALIMYADDKYFDRGLEKWVQEHHKDLIAIGFDVKSVDGIYYTEHIDSFELATKYLHKFENIDTIDITEKIEGDEIIILKEGKNVKEISGNYIEFNDCINRA